MRRGATAIVAGIVLSCGLAYPVLAGAPTRTPAAGPVAANFSREDLDHRTIELAAYRGKIVLLDFWATWCAPCLAEMPRFAEWQQKYGPRGFQVLGVSMDDDAAPARTASHRLKLNYPVVMGDEKLGGLYGGILGLPLLFLIDGDGRIRFRHEGEIKLEVLEREIQELLPRP